MAEAVIVEAVRSPVGKRNGALSGIHPAELSPGAQRPGRACRCGAALVDDVIWGLRHAGRRAGPRHRPHGGAIRRLASRPSRA